MHHRPPRRPFRLAAAVLAAAASLAALAQGCAPAADTGDDADSAFRRTDPGFRVSGNDLVLDTKLLGASYTLASTAIVAKWNEECGPTPADYVARLPGDVPDTCEHQIIPLASRTVTFAKLGKQIVMADRTPGGGAQELARFPVLAETPAEIRFSFNPARVPTRINVFKKTPVPFPASVAIAQARVKARVREGWAAIQQDGVLALAEPGVPGRIKYGLTRAVSNPAFKAQAQRDGARRLFEINTAARATARFDLSQPRPIVIRGVNAPTGADRAIAELALQLAVNYWNRVFQAASGASQRVFFTLAKDDGTAFAHDPGFNVVQWMRSPKNGTSTGVFQTEPVTGETLFANAYISSGFFGTARTVGARFYSATQKKAAPEAAIKQFVEDYITETVTHEIGHMLGLQHNFEASNVSRGKTPAALPALATAYFQGKELPDPVSSSIMEYLPIPLAGVLGRRLRTAVLPYDLYAVAQAYFPSTKLAALETRFGKPFTDAAKAAYCNDDDLGEAHPNCQQFDHPMCAYKGMSCFAEDG